MQPMKVIGLVLLSLAAGKLALKDYVWRQSAAETIVAAHRERAVLACQNERRVRALGITPVVWQPALRGAVRIGEPQLNVAFWQVDHPQWAHRYKQPFMRLVADDKVGTLHCLYDLTTGRAAVALA